MCVLPSENEGVILALSPYCPTFSAGYLFFLDLSFLNSKIGIVFLFSSPYLWKDWIKKYNIQDCF